MKKFFGVAVTLIITLYLLIEFIGDRLIKNVLQNNISSALNREVSIENLNVILMVFMLNLLQFH